MKIDFWTNKDRLYTKVFKRTYNAKSRFVLSYGGSGSSKSYSEAQNEVIKSFKKGGGNLLIVRKTYSTMEESCYNLLKEVIYSFGIQQFFSFKKSPLQIVNKVSGKRFIFKGLDDTEKIKSIAKIQRCWIEEANEISSKDFRELNRRIRGFENIQIIILLNPVSEQHWIKKYFIDNEKYASKTTVIHSTYKDNDFIGQDYADEMEALKLVDENEYRIYALGEWGVNQSGLIYRNWTTCDKFPGVLDYWYGIDFGYENDPTGIVRIALDRRINTIFLQEVCLKTKMDSVQIANAIKQDHITAHTDLYEDETKHVYVEDSNIHVNDQKLYIESVWQNKGDFVALLKSANFDNSNIEHICKRVDRMKSVKLPIYCDHDIRTINEIRQCNVSAEKAIKTEKAKQIQAIKRLKVCYTRSSKGIDEGVKNYSWLEKKNGEEGYQNEPDHFLSDIMDAIRYGAYTHLTRIKYIGDGNKAKKSNTDK